LSVAGVALVTLSAVVFLFVLLLDMFGLHTNPYLGIVFFLILPGFFVLGLLMIPGRAVPGSARRRRGLEPLRLPRIDLNDPVHRRGVLAVTALTLVNVLIVSLAAYKGIEFMDSPQFCGQVCHTVMEPEFSAYQDGPHSRVRCVDCHIGPGAPWFVKSKLDGTRQVLAVMRGTYSKPDRLAGAQPAPRARHLRAVPLARRSSTATRSRSSASTANDEKNTESVTRLMVHVGGGSERLGVANGIHWHMNVANVIEYVTTDEKRQTIPYVKLTDRQGTVREFRTTGVTDDQLAKGERRRMDCMDCHNRPSHPFSASPQRAVDGAMARGEIPRTLPFARREAVEALKGDYADRPAAEREIAQRLRTFYGQNYAALVPAHGGEIDQLVRARAAVVRRNVFPAMKVTWGTHENNLGHTDAPGCFRCHDDQHKTADGRVIKQDCDLCHDIQ
jgi:nitrate/TMAO reductase-like tetraheme cytochrome c subunit